MSNTFRFILVTLLATLLLPLVSALPTPVLSGRSGNGINPPLSMAGWVGQSTPPSPRSLTNAERLARGLSLNPPSFNSRRAAPAASPAPITRYSGIVQASNGAGALGYIDINLNAYGELKLTTDISQALRIEILDDETDELTVQHTNGNLGSFTLLGGITGFASTDHNLGSGSYNYAYLGGVTATTRDSPPVLQDNSFTVATAIPESVESVIWGFEPSTNMITLQWVNTDGSKPATTIAYAPTPDDALVITGDISAFENQFSLGNGAVSLQLIR